MNLAGKSDKEVKEVFKLEISKDPDKYYPTAVLKKEGFTRGKCKCGTYFWSVNGRKTCGDSACAGGFTFFKDNPCKKKLSLLGVWKEFSKMFDKLGYKPILRYPIVARWRADMDFTIASIANFQPYVVSGEVEPPAESLVVPQFCLRFGDTDNVGITGSHMTCFNMIGQHKFVPPERWNQEQVFKDIHKWLKEGMGIPNEEIIFHEDAWAGGGNFGPCIEFFSRGLEIGNQVYMLYEQTGTGHRELKLKVLDMGMGMERCAWFSQGEATIYDATFPKVMEKLRKKTSVKINKELLERYVPYAGHLNFDEAENIDEAWDFVAKKVGHPVEKLKEELYPSVALYSIAEHARGLLISLTDGALPSNVGGGYNLRIILRRALSFIDKFGWDIDLGEVCKWHAEELKEGFPELLDNIDTVKKIIGVEKQKYLDTKEKAKHIIERLLKKGEINEEELLEQYDSNGVSPELIADEAEKQGKKVAVPSDFYKKVAEMHEHKAQATATKKEERFEIPEIDPTEALYFGDWKPTEFEAKVLWKKDNHVILDQTMFYPTSGGQLSDEGLLKFNGAECAVVNVVKQGSYIIHELRPCKMQEGSKVKGTVNYERREQLAQHHTATHIVNAAAKRVLGAHIWQAGAAKTTEKARLDLTHFDSISKDELQQIEDEANKIVVENHPVYKRFVKRNIAEAEYGFVLYQGGVVPGKELRVVEIPGVDVEACGGTHLNLTGEAVKIKILKSSKLQDGIVRIEFAAGDAAEKFEKKEDSVLGETATLLNVEADQIPGRVEELFKKWKNAKKAVKKKQQLKKEDIELTSKVRFSETVPKDEQDRLDELILSKTAKILRTQPEHIPKIIQRFLRELEQFRRSSGN
ncbi:MAG: alanine--tRNA ligase [Candidatus Nanoarchaeia archaeon]